MDPTLRQTVAAFLDSLATTHQVTDQDDVDAAIALKRKRPTVGSCTCGDRLTAGPERHILDLIWAEFAPPASTPHVIHAERSVFEDHDDVVLDDDRDESDVRPAGTVVTGRSYVGPLHCPDCGKGLRSRADGSLICQALSRDEPTKACHEGCIVACGQEG